MNDPYIPWPTLLVDNTRRDVSSAISCGKASASSRCTGESGVSGGSSTIVPSRKPSAI